MYGFFFFKVTATTEIYTLSLHDALPIVPPLVMKLDAGDQVVHLGDVGENACPDYWVLFDQIELFGGERASFAQHCFRHTNLSDIVHEA